MYSDTSVGSNTHIQKLFSGYFRVPFALTVGGKTVHGFVCVPLRKVWSGWGGEEVIRMRQLLIPVDLAVI